MKEEFNLSEKIQEYQIEEYFLYIPIKDVHEFIKLLKEEFRKYDDIPALDAVLRLAGEKLI